MAHPLSAADLAVAQSWARRYSWERRIAFTDELQQAARIAAWRVRLKYGRIPLQEFNKIIPGAVRAAYVDEIRALAGRVNSLRAQTTHLHDECLEKFCGTQQSPLDDMLCVENRAEKRWMMFQAASPRERRALRAFLASKTFREAGVKIRLSESRVHQLVARTVRRAKALALLG